jgi:ATP-dependent Lon protease
MSENYKQPQTRGQRTGNANSTSDLNNANDTTVVSELQLLQNKLSQVQNSLPEELLRKGMRMVDRLRALQSSGPIPTKELDIISKYIDWITRIPYGNYTSDNLDIENAKQKLNESHYGLDGVKERVLEYIATKRLIEIHSERKQIDSGGDGGSADPSGPRSAVPHHYNEYNQKNPILGFIGVQGVGKTTMAKAVARALGRGFQRIALGAFADVAEIRGKSRAETGAEPGQIIKALIRAKSMNPVILLDEIDKVSDGNGVRADIMAALLEILDPEQNHAFVDRYVDHPVDLSQVIFITTANNVGGISSALLDRIELIRFTSYDDAEKKKIAKNYLLPKVRRATGVTEDMLEFSEDVWELIIRPHGTDPGVRSIERTLMNLARKVAKLKVEGLDKKIIISPDNFREFIPEQINVYT